MPAAEREEGTFPEVQGDQRERMRRLEAKRKLRIDVVDYLIVNLFLVIVWAISGGGAFWPGWVMAVWGLLLVFKVYLRKPITELQIDEELRRRWSPWGGGG
jgi:2TM domain